jgi:tetratricopeptide (TPR) repeat protein
MRRHAVSLDWPFFPKEASLDFIAAGSTNRDYSTTLGAVNWDLFYEELEAGEFFQAMAADMRRNWDYILIDSRTGLSDIAEICTVEMPDILVVCFTLSTQSVVGASTIAHRIHRRYGDRGIRILPVPMRVDEGEKEKADTGRAYAREAFKGLPSGLGEEALNRYWGSVEFPYKPYYGYEEILAVFGDQPQTANTLLAACERLTAELTEGEITGLPPMDADLRTETIGNFTRHLSAAQPAVPDVVVHYSSEDRMWADWIVQLLRQAQIGVTARNVSIEEPADGEERQMPVPRPGAVARSLVLLSQQSERSLVSWPAGEVLGGDHSGQSQQVIPVRVSGMRSPGSLDAERGVDLTTRIEERSAAAAILTALGQETEPKDVELPDRSGPRFPATRPKISNVRLRNPAFTGRAEALEQLRLRLGGGMTAAQSAAQTLFGLGGVGKSQVALEYSYRFMADYDLIWWMDAEQPDQIAVSLSELARRLGLPVGESVSDAADSAMNALRQGAPTSRWLLVFDNADDPDTISQYLPNGPGHILVTSRNQAWNDRTEAQRVDVFSRQESIEHLCRGVSGLSAEDAARVAEVVGDLPLAVGIAAAWLESTAMPVNDYVDQLNLQVVETLDAPDPVGGYPRSFAAAWNVSISKLREESRASARLLELCAFFSADSIPMSLLNSNRMLRSLMKYDQDLQDRYMLGREIQRIGRFGLAKADAGSKTLQVHRMVQAVIRRGLTREETEATSHEVHRVLVDARPGDVDHPWNWGGFDEIWPHLGPSEALECDEPDTRQLLIDRVRYLWKRGELEAAENLGRQLDKAWTAKLGQEDRQTLLLRFQLASVLRTQGRYQEALKLDQDTHRSQQNVLVAGHINTLMTAGNVAADLRALGRYREALDLDLATHGEMRANYDLREERPLAMANNIGVDYRFMGDYGSAEQTDREVLDQRTQVLGPEHPYTLGSKALLAADQRGLGEYRQSVVLLQEVVEAFRSLPSPADFPEELRHRKSLAVSLRKAGLEGEARRMTREVFERYRTSFSPDSPDVLACQLNLAADEEAAGEYVRACELAEEVHVRLLESLGADHPYTLIAANNLVIYRRLSGEPAAAVELGTQTRDAMGTVLGRDHPSTLCAMLNLANALADLDGEEALVRVEDLETTALSILTERFGEEGPDILVAQSNLAVTLRESGRPQQAEQQHDSVLDRFVRLLDDTHPVTRTCRNWQRIDRDLEIEPW